MRRRCFVEKTIVSELTVSDNHIMFLWQQVIVDGFSTMFFCNRNH
jgi:hypothetical protein